MGRKKIEIESGKQFGRLTIVKEVEPHIQPNGQVDRKVLCYCECGNEKIIQLNNLKNNHTTSCGCYIRQISSNGIKLRSITHGKTKHPLYATWANMKYRCINENSSNYKHYGNKGIQVCDRWINSFPNFLADMGERPVGMTLDRIDINGNYEPSNCRWATYKQQAQNRTTTLCKK